MGEKNAHSLILQSRMNRFRDLTVLVTTLGIVIARGIWKLFSKATIKEEDKEMKPWE